MSDTTTEVEPAAEAEGGALVAASEHAPAMAEEHSHPGPVQYVLIAVVLCVLTGVEVALSYLDGDINSNLLIAMLSVLAFVKFFIVAAWYMHMKLDQPFFRRIFIVGIVLAGFVYGVVMFTFASTTLSS